MGYWKYKTKQYMEINLDLFYKLQECPKKFSFYKNEKRKTPGELFQTLYEKKLKDRNIEIYAVAKATGDDFEAWNS